MSLSVVFDSAGTLMKTVRAVFSRETGNITFDKETTLLVFEDKDRVLVLINAGNCDILSGKPDMPLFCWISENNISYAVSCGHGTFEDATRIIKNDSASTLQYLQNVVLACRAEAEKESGVFALNTLHSRSYYQVTQDSRWQEADLQPHRAAPDRYLRI